MAREFQERNIAPVVKQPGLEELKTPARELPVSWESMVSFPATAGQAVPVRVITAESRAIDHADHVGYPANDAPAFKLSVLPNVSTLPQAITHSLEQAATSPVVFLGTPSFRSHDEHSNRIALAMREG